MNRWDGQFLASFLREPEPGEFPLDPEAGSRSNRPIYDVNRADLHMAYDPALVRWLTQYVRVCERTRS
jgi:hypothetical protein